jgi:thioesterase domain-containing protein
MPDENDRSWSAQSWRPFVAGEIIEYSVDCTHQEMLTAESVSWYGPQLKLLLES